MKGSPKLVRLACSGVRPERTPIFDGVETICSACHERDLAVMFRSDGNFMEILADLVAAGVDGINPIANAAGSTSRAFCLSARRRRPAPSPGASSTRRARKGACWWARRPRSATTFRPGTTSRSTINQ